MNKYVEWLANQGTVQSDEVDSLLIDYFTQICRSLLRDSQKGKEGLRLTLVKHELNILACILRICQKDSGDVLDYSSAGQMLWGQMTTDSEQIVPKVPPKDQPEFTKVLNNFRSMGFQDRK